MLIDIDVFVYLCDCAINDETSFHTMINKSISMLSYYRISWALVLLAAAGFLLYVVIEKLKYYYSYPSTISFDVKYNDSMTFPAVTICNQNPYRYISLSYFICQQIINQYICEHVYADSYNTIVRKP